LAAAMIRDELAEMFECYF